MAFTLSTTNVFIVSIVMLLFYRFATLIYRFYFHPLSKFPGPKYLAASALSQFYYQNIKGTFYKEIRDLHDQYGEIVRVAPNELSIDGSIGWDDIYGHKKAGQVEFGKDSLFYRPLDQGKGLDGHGAHDIIMSNREDHRRQRRLMAHAFSDAALYAQEDIIKSYVDLLMRRLEEHSVQGKKLDMVKWYNYTTFDIISDLAFNDTFGSLESSAMHPWVSMIFDFIKVNTQLRLFAQYPILKPFVGFVINQSDIDVIERNQALTSAKLDKRLAQETNGARNDFLTYILQHNDEKGMSHPEILGNCETLIVAGSETTATLLSGLTYYLSQSPEAWKRLKDEVRGAFKTEEEITMRSTAALPYLFACLEEGLRMYPPAVVTPPRFSPGATVNGEYIPEGVSPGSSIHTKHIQTLDPISLVENMQGKSISLPNILPKTTQLTPKNQTKVWIHAYSTTHRSSNFHLPDTFAPERWLPDMHPYYSPRFAHDNRSSMRPFSHGPRNCIGKNLAYSEMRLILAKLAWKFELELAPESEGWDVGQKVFTNFEKPPLVMRLHLVAGAGEK
ncbi:Cytochrome P450 monooxygenase [Lachnellula hyalina]|uniref:Cytochrome P450 monooxygenase n=1 Tax=Lachnellula hyalina TaxID=1316788 RepID=A0A8H8TWU8_9HELO|nr:Cytochrome P450 monooxygenase [Lachnellula hyalina]TVY25314.1 Cytochrome P450 monooxygenase [Lachnellula hyalina]